MWFCKGGQDGVDRRPDKVVYSRVEVATDSAGMGTAGGNRGDGNAWRLRDRVDLLGAGSETF